MSLPSFIHELIGKVTRQDRLALAKLISSIENGDEKFRELLKQNLQSFRRHSKVIGLTGPLGAGKSSLINSLITKVRNEKLTVGVFAVDPSSPFSRGAILGDRIRMQSNALDEGVFIRSCGMRGERGHLVPWAMEVILAYNAFGMDLVLVETVGSGQNDWEIHEISDVTIVVITAGSGDSIQWMKSGILEIGDIYCVNKKDREPTEAVVRELSGTFLSHPSPKGFERSIVTTSTVTGEGIDQLFKSMMSIHPF